MEKDKRAQEQGRRTKLARLYSPRPRLRDPSTQSALLLIAASFSIALLLSPALSSQNADYEIGDVAGHNIKAQHDFLILDERATQKKREEAIKSAPLIYDFDENAVTRIDNKLERSFEKMREFFRAKLPSPSQMLNPDRGVETSHFPLNHAEYRLVLTRLAYGRKESFESDLGFSVPNSIYAILVVNHFSEDIVDRVKKWLKGAMNNGIVSTRRLSFQIRNPSSDYVIRKLPSNEEIHISNPQYYRDMEDAMSYISARRASEEGDIDELKAAAFLSMQLIEPNIVFNRIESGQRRSRAGDAVKPVYIQVKKNEMLAREGQRIGPAEFLKLQAYRSSGPDHHRTLTFVAIFLFSLIYCSVILHMSRHHLPIRRVDFKDILFLSVLLVFLLFLGRSSAWIMDTVGNSAFFDPKSFMFAIPVAAGAMLCTIFFGITESLVFSLSLSLFLGVLFNNNFNAFVYFLVGSFVGAHGVSPCRNRMVPIKTGILVGIANVAMLVVMALLNNQWAALALVFHCLFGFLGGVFSGIMVTGIAPLAEMIFGYTTDIKLLELASMDQPLLQELMVQAPGTYHHSIIVGNMVETAAKSIGANSLLAKVAAYYHDIGKIKKPLYFIENQVGCENRHEKLAPSMSSLILMSHVKEGIELGKKHRLGQPIRDIISQHHGSSLISYFYQKALDARKKAQDTKGAELPKVDIEDYRYPGPKPQTREAGLVMLADVVEAACRSLADPTPARIQGMVSRLVNSVFSDGQLDECELTLKDLHQIARCFNQILATVHHKRIEYPAQSQSNQKGKQNAADSAQHESGSDRGAGLGNSKSRRTDLKRLGLH